MLWPAQPDALAATNLRKTLHRLHGASHLAIARQVLAEFAGPVAIAALFGLPLAMVGWQPPTLVQWGSFLVAGVLGSVGHYCLTRGFRAADISATQSLRFLDLVWATLLGWLVFSDVPRTTTLLGALVIMLSTLWIARRESRQRIAKSD